jgi:hypothetical protein
VTDKNGNTSLLSWDRRGSDGQEQERVSRYKKTGVLTGFEAISAKSWDVKKCFGGRGVRELLLAEGIIYYCKVKIWSGQMSTPLLEDQMLRTNGGARLGLCLRRWSQARPVEIVACLVACHRGFSRVGPAFCCRVNEFVARPNQLILTSSSSHVPASPSATSNKQTTKRAVDTKKSKSLTLLPSTLSKTVPRDRNTDAKMVVSLPAELQVFRPGT